MIECYDCGQKVSAFEAGRCADCGNDLCPACEVDHDCEEDDDDA